MDDRHVMRIIKAAERIADATEKIAATLQRMADNDPMDGIMKALEAEAKETPQEQPEQDSQVWRICRGCDAKMYENVRYCPHCGFDHQSSRVAYGADLPESERWRLGQ